MNKVLALSDLAYVSYPVVPLRWLCALARLQGTVLYLTPRQSAAVRDNLASVNGRLSERELRAMTHRFFQYGSLRTLMFILAPKLTDDTMSRLFTVDGLDRLDQALAMKKGVILLASHLNSLSMFLFVITLRRRGYDIRTALTVEQDNWSGTWFRSLFNRMTGDRTYFDHVGAFYCQFNIRPIVRALAQGAAVLQTGDGWHSAEFAEVEFLNRRLPFTTGMLRIAQATGATVVPIFAAGTPPDRLKFVMEEPFVVPKNEPLDDKVATYAKRLEHYLLQNPECWAHWSRPHTLQTLVAWPSQTLKERYSI